MGIYYDLHMHSCLSPCAENDMTPNNIVNMALLKGLQVIAVSDHQTVGNIAAVMAVGNENGLLVIPAMEVCTAEEIHLLALFPTLTDAVAFESELTASCQVPENRPDIFGDQFLMNENDEIVGTVSRMLLAAGGWDAGQTIDCIRKHHGKAIPAHIDRDGYSMLTTLGAIPPEYQFDVIEISFHVQEDDFRKDHPELDSCRIISNSDAHRLWEIAEPHFQLQIESPTHADFWAWLNR